MQRRSSSSHSVSSYNQGSTANNLGLVQHNVGFFPASGHGDWNTYIGWIGQSSSIGSYHNQVTPEELNSVCGWLPSPAPNIGTSQRLGEMHSEPNSDNNLSTDLVTLGPSTSRSATSDAVHHKLDLNVAYEDNYGNIRQEMGADYVNQTSSLERNSDIFERNTRRRINPTNEQNFPPLGMSSSVHVGTTSQHLQPPCTNWITSSSSSSSSSVSPIIPASLSDTVWQEENLQYIPRGTSVQRMQVPRTQRGAPGQNLSTSRAFPRNYNSRVGDTGVQPSAAPRLPDNVTGGFQNGFTSGIHLSSTPGFPPWNMADEYEQRVSDIANHSMMRLAGFGSGGQIGYILPTSIASVTRNAGALQALPNQIPRPPGILMMRAVGSNAVLPSILPPLQPVFAAQWRARLDGMIVHGPEFYEDLDYGLDVHEDMRLDVDNMSYEELLALEEHIGNVSAGLSEEAIFGAMRRRRYQSMKLGPPLEEEPCCICQDDYVDGEELGKLECGHDFHFNCIKQWLIQKNSCPICKTTALAI